MIVPEITDHPQEPAVPIAVAAPTRPRSRLLDRLRRRPRRRPLAIGARHHRRAADEHMRDNAAQVNPLGLR